jgi:uncharacterized membrane protein YdcZ (DUF606 family)
MKRVFTGQYLCAFGAGIIVAGDVIAINSNQSFHSSDPHTASGLSFWIGLPFLVIGLLLWKNRADS